SSFFLGLSLVMGLRYLSFRFYLSYTSNLIAFSTSLYHIILIIRLFCSKFNLFVIIYPLCQRFLLVQLIQSLYFVRWIFLFYLKIFILSQLMSHSNQRVLSVKRVLKK